MVTPQVTQRDPVLKWNDEGNMPRGNNAAYRLTDAEAKFDDAMAQAAAHVAPEPQKVLVKATTIIRRRGYFLRLCECGHAGRANFHNGDEGAAFELIAANTWKCGWCLSEKANPGKDDAEYAKATDTTPEPLPLGVRWNKAERARFHDGEGER